MDFDLLAKTVATVGHGAAFAAERGKESLGPRERLRVVAGALSVGHDAFLFARLRLRPKGCVLVCVGRGMHVCLRICGIRAHQTRGAQRPLTQDKC